MQPVMSWEEAPVAPWHQDGSVALFLVLHSSTGVLLATLGLLTLRQQFQIGLASLGTGISVGVVAWIVGGILAFPVAFRLAPPLSDESLFQCRRARAICRGMDLL